MFGKVNFLVILGLICLLLTTGDARIHKLKIMNDARKYIGLSTFGFYQGGSLEVNLYNFHSTSKDNTPLFGFSLDKTINDGINPYFDSHQETCILQRNISNNVNEESIYVLLDLKLHLLKVKCADHQLSSAIHIYQNDAEVKKSPTAKNCKDISFPIKNFTVNQQTYYNASFLMLVKTVNEEGLYNLFFHNCPNYNPKTESFVDFQIEIVELNNGNYLSAGEMPLPALYCMMSILFFLSGMFWVFLLKQSKHPVFKIHYMMAVLVFLKAISLAFHGVNYHFIERLGFHLTTWAILFYVAHLLKGALLFVVLVLIGTGWTFIKHVLTPKDKKLFMVVIPLQVFANIAEIILEESEEGDREYLAWRNMVTLVDLLCCGCILFPVVWSIRHLQEASETDGKAAINLKKLKLFRHFYVMVVCYIYSTRIIVYLLKMTVPFQYGWLHEMFLEMSTYVFFVLTAYKFRPASRNPYFALSDDECDVDEVYDEILYIEQEPLDIKQEPDDDGTRDQCDITPHSNEFKCCSCDKSFTRNGHLLRHTKRLHSQSDVFKCELCDKSFSHQDNLLNHTKRHSANETTCKLCQKSFNNKDYLLRHTKRVHLDLETTEVFKCEFCSKSFKVKEYLVGHTKRQHSDVYEKLTCEFCDKSFRKKCDLRLHIKRRHLGDYGKFDCEFCSKSFKLEEYLVGHVKRQHSMYSNTFIEEVLRLEQEPLDIKEEPNDMEDEYEVGHQETSNNKIFTCELCGKFFKYRYNLYTHTKTSHLVIKKAFQCKQCDKSFNRLKSLEKHHRDHNETSVCEICEKTFKNKNGLTLHTTMQHSGKVKQFRCDICDKTFKQRGRLFNHTEAEHSEEQNKFKCVICYKTFNYKNSLVAHTTIQHSGKVKQFKCDFCDKTFKRRGRLFTHTEAEHSEKQKKFKCVTCYRTFKYKNGLVAHTRIHHPNPTN